MLKYPLFIILYTIVPMPGPQLIRCLAIVYDFDRDLNFFYILNEK